MNNDARGFHSRMKMRIMSPGFFDKLQTSSLALGNSINANSVHVTVGIYISSLRSFNSHYQHKTQCGINFSGSSIPSPEPSPDHTNSSTESPRQTTSRVSPKTGVNEAKRPQNGPLFWQNSKTHCWPFLDIRESCRRAHRNESYQVFNRHKLPELKNVPCKPNCITLHDLGSEGNRILLRQKSDAYWR